VPDWVGAVLTGGASSRMGRDKAAIEVDGVAMADRVVASLVAAGASSVVTVGGAGADLDDDHPGAGPLGAVLTSLRWAAGRVVVVAPCDLVAPDASAFAALAAAAPAVGGVGEPLPVAVGPGALEPLAAAFEAGERSLRRALEGLAVTVVDVGAGALADADVPSELPPGAR
jgi:molybdopterin-guanine dinucleotide biosynthesis protein A